MPLTEELSDFFQALSDLVIEHLSHLTPEILRPAILRSLYEAARTAL